MARYVQRNRSTFQIGDQPFMLGADARKCVEDQTHVGEVWHPHRVFQNKIGHALSVKLRREAKQQDHGSGGGWTTTKVDVSFLVAGEGFEPSTFGL
jgi:hypothetical protein